MANSTVWKCIIWFQIIHKNYNISHVFSQPSLSYFKNPLFIPFSVSLSLSLSLSIEFCTLNKTEGSWSYKIAPVFWNGKMEMNIRFGFNTFLFLNCELGRHEVCLNMEAGSRRVLKKSKTWSENHWHLT